MGPRIKEGAMRWQRHLVSRNPRKSGPRKVSLIPRLIRRRKELHLNLSNTDILHRSYCWFSVSRHSKQIKIKKIKSIQQIKSRIWKQKEGRYAWRLAKIQVTATFLMDDMRRNVFPKFIEICMETPCWCPPRWTPQHHSSLARHVNATSRKSLEIQAQSITKPRTHSE